MTERQVWWHDGALWWPCESADGRQRFTDARWVPKRRGFRALEGVSYLWLLVSPFALIFFGGVANYSDVDEPPSSDLSILISLGIDALWVPVGLLGVWVAIRIQGRPGLGERGRVRWIWTPPPGWSTPAGWTPWLGWEPDPSWPSPPAQWRGWVRQWPKTFNW